MGHERGNIVFELRLLDNLLKKNAEAHFRGVDGEEQLTRMHHWIIGYLYDHRDQDIYQRDIEAEFKVSRSTTSNMLSLMEKKQMIKRLNVENDARLKKVVLTEKAVELHLLHMDTARKLDDMIEEAITSEEKAELIRILDKIRVRVMEALEEKHVKIDDDRR